jgi:hypothetical protein
VSLPSGREGRFPVLQALKKCPLPLAVLSCLLAATGVLGIAAQPVRFWTEHHFELDMVWAGLVSAVAIVSGVYMLRGNNWARWLAMAWIVFHVVLSLFHAWQQVAIHGVIFAAFAFFLFRPEANVFFRPKKN